MSAVFVFSVHAVSGDLEALFVQHDRHGTVLDPGVDGTTEQRLHLLRSRRSSNVPVLRASAQDGIPHATAYHIGFEPGILYGLYDIFRFFRYLYLNHIYPLLQKSHTLIAL